MSQALTSCTGNFPKFTKMSDSLKRNIFDKLYCNKKNFSTCSVIIQYTSKHILKDIHYHMLKMDMHHASI